MVKHYASIVLAVFDLGALTYFVLLNSLYVAFTVIAFVTLLRHRRRWTTRELDAVIRSPATPGISLIVPAYNEETSIAESIRSLLVLNYPQFEVIVVNDGSRDQTLERLVATFEMLVAPAGHASALPTAAVRGFYRSLAHRDLMVIDKTNGGKADAINAGINAASHPLICVLDADSLLEEHALTRAVLPFVEDPHTLAAGGIVRIANGCRIEAGRVMEVGLPRSHLARFQVVEYLRAFLAGRVALSATNALLLISGAFGIFRRAALVDAGGFRVDTVGEDMEIIVRLHRRYRERGEPYRIVFQPDPVCWTEVPETTRVLSEQRNRWERGTLQVMEYHRRMIGNPRYGVVGVFAMPYYGIFEALGPAIEVLALIVTMIAVPLGMLDTQFALLMLLAAIGYGAVISIAAVLLEEASYRRYPRLTDLFILCGYALVENFGYRQMTSWWRLKGMIDYLRKRGDWGTMTRKGFAGP